MGAKDSTEDIVAKASMEEAALWARAEWEALRAEVVFRAEVPVMLEGAVTLEEALQVEVDFMVEAVAAVTLEAVAFAVEAAGTPVGAGAGAGSPPEMAPMWNNSYAGGTPPSAAASRSCLCLPDCTNKFPAA